MAARRTTARRACRALCAAPAPAAGRGPGCQPRARLAGLQPRGRRRWGGQREAPARQDRRPTAATALVVPDPGKAARAGEKGAGDRGGSGTHHSSPSALEGVAGRRLPRRSLRGKPPLSSPAFFVARRQRRRGGRKPARTATPPQLHKRRPPPNGRQLLVRPSAPSAADSSRPPAGPQAPARCDVGAARSPVSTAARRTTLAQTLRRGAFGVGAPVSSLPWLADAAQWPPQRALAASRKRTAFCSKQRRMKPQASPPRM